MSRSGISPHMASGRLRLHQQPGAPFNDDVMGRLPKKLLGAPEVKPLHRDGHFSMNGTSFQACASHASLERNDGEVDSPPRISEPGDSFGAPKPGKKRAKDDVPGIKLSNKSHRSSINPVAFLCSKSEAYPALPSYLGPVLKVNRHALIVDCCVTRATGTVERGAAKAMPADHSGAH